MTTARDTEKASGMKEIGRIVTVYGNMVSAEVSAPVAQNTVAYCRRSDGVRLLSEVIRIRGRRADLQVFEETRGLRAGDGVEFSGELLSVSLGPGLLGQIYNGLQDPLPVLAERGGYFLTPGLYADALRSDIEWQFMPAVAPGNEVSGGDAVGFVPEGIFEHRIMVPFAWKGRFKVKEIAEAGAYPIHHQIAVLEDTAGQQHKMSMVQRWPVKRALQAGRRRLMPVEPLVTQVRIIDTMFPIVRGGTYCIPGPFGAGKTVLQQITARFAEVDVVVVAACGERAGEVVETLREFPKLSDPRTGRTLMERTIIIANTSSMPVAAREASVYTAVTLAEYYRQMGLNVLLLADSTSRWAEAMREISGRLEEIPGEEAFPAYLESRIAAFYERAGTLELNDGRTGSVTIGGTVSPAGGNFEEPVTQGTLKVVGAFHGLSKARSDARRYPSIDPIDSWSKYGGIIDRVKQRRAAAILRRGNEIKQMMTVVGEEGTALDDFVTMLKAEFFDNCYLQQNAFDKVDAATPAWRQQFVFDKLLEVLDLDLQFEDKKAARGAIVEISDLFRNWQYTPATREVVRRLSSAPDLNGLPESEGDEGNAEFVTLLGRIDAFISRHRDKDAPVSEPAETSSNHA